TADTFLDDQRRAARRSRYDRSTAGQALQRDHAERLVVRWHRHDISGTVEQRQLLLRSRAEETHLVGYTQLTTQGVEPALLGVPGYAIGLAAPPDDQRRQAVTPDEAALGQQRHCMY